MFGIVKINVERIIKDGFRLIKATLGLARFAAAFASSHSKVTVVS
jgi:hypothetical protein